MNAGTQGPARLLGRVIGGYRLASVLGKGATGVVFLGERTDEARQILERTGREPIVLPEQAAVKVLILPWQLDDAERAEFRRRFVREAQTLQRLRHPNILPVLISGEDDATGSSFMVLPYVPGGTLHERLAAAGPLPLAEANAILAQVAAAIDFAHQSHVLHRDIKPGNILLGADGQAYLSDFSIARLLSETTTHLTKTGNALGTPIYMPPEALAGQPVGAAGDIFSLGMVLYEMVTGLRTAITNPPAPARMMRPDLPPPAEAAIQMATDANPAQRFASASALAEDFGAGIEGRWAPGLTRYVAATRHSTGAPAAMYAAPTAIQSWPTPQTTRQRRVSPAMTALLAGAATLLLVSCFALAASNRAGLVNFLGGGGASGFGGAGRRSSPSSQTSQPTATAHQSHGAGGPVSTNTPQIVYVGGTPQPTDTSAPGNTPSPTDTPTDTPTPTPTITPTPTPEQLDVLLRPDLCAGHNSDGPWYFPGLQLDNPMATTVHWIATWPDEGDSGFPQLSLSSGDIPSGGTQVISVLGTSTSWGALYVGFWSEYDNSGQIPIVVHQGAGFCDAGPSTNYVCESYCS